MTFIKQSALVLLLGVVACSDPGVPRGKILDTGLAKVQSLDVYSDNSKLHVLVAGTAANTTVQTYYLSSDNSGRHWSAPVRVDAGIAPPHKPARNTDAHIVAAGPESRGQ